MNIRLIYNTIKDLKKIQLYYQVFYRIRNKVLRRKFKKRKAPLSNCILWNEGIMYSNRYSNYYSFEFLNIKHKFSDKIDWNLNTYGKLWTYNLNYFDFLNQTDMTKEMGLHLLYDYIKNDPILIDGKEPYPISLRGMNWVKFLSKYEVKDNRINDILYSHYRILLKSLEFHLLGNHLLENAFSLLFGAYYFQEEQLYKVSKKLLISQLNEQILNDGGHYELSAMYHQILFFRILDCIQLITLNPTWKKDSLLEFLKTKASAMRSWLEIITYRNGDVPMMSDSAFDIAFSTRQLLMYADQLMIDSLALPLSESGYRKVVYNNYELFMDVGNIQPSYQPGHTHSDTFHFDLYKNNQPIFIDMGISTYEKNERRQHERSTASHNTVEVAGKNQTEVWGGFRVGRKAKVTILSEKSNELVAVHDGYKKLGCIHERTFEWSTTNITLEDKIFSSAQNNAVASFHLHSSIDQPNVEKDTVHLIKQNVSIHFQGQKDIQIKKYQLPNGYNKMNTAFKIIVNFHQNLVTKISL